jgi:hypothetical protein
VLNCNNEIWKPVIGFEKLYEVSNKGRVRNTRNKILKTYKTNSGYDALKFTVSGKRTAHLVHRLVAKAFLTNPKSLKEVNHIDEVKSNNSLTNLEWVSSSQNKQHSLKSGNYIKIFETKNSLGKKHLPDNHSKYHNVTFHKSRNKWAATIRVNGKNMFQKRFDSEKDAALHVNWIIDKLGLIDRPKNVIT